MTKEQAIKLLGEDTSREEINRLEKEGHSKEDILDIIQEALDMGIDALEKQTWISVKDRLPPEPRIGENGYIVQEKNVCEPFSAYWDGERWTDSNYEPIDDVIAWMPLPESYKED